jgi:hypothetical protein
MMHTHTICIYTADSALQAEDAALAVMKSEPVQVDWAVNESSLEHFCAFVDFYTRHATDPMSTSLACEKQSEAVELTQEDVTPENIRLLMDTLLVAIEHLEKKWLDEQLELEDRQRKHREDVARLYRQLREFQEKPRARWYRGLTWFLT